MWKPRPDNELWERVCREGSSAGATLALMPETLMQLCLMLPRRFVSYLEGLANGVDESRATVQPQIGPHAVTRNRELLPLPFILPSAEDLPAHNVAGDQTTLKRSQAGWMFLVVVTLNYHWGLGSASRASPVLMGPASIPQYAALVRLATAADAMCEMHPGELSDIDWETEFKTAHVSYGGEEVTVAQALSVEQLEAGLPPKGLAGSIDIVPLPHGYAKECILDPSRVRLAPEEIDRQRSRRRMSEQSRRLRKRR